MKMRRQSNRDAFTTLEELNNIFYIQLFQSWGIVLGFLTPRIFIRGYLCLTHSGL